MIYDLWEKYLDGGDFKIREIMGVPRVGTYLMTHRDCDRSQSVDHRWGSSLNQ